MLSLQELCNEKIINYTTTFYGIDRLPLPNKLKKSLKYYFNAHKYELTSKLMNSSSPTSPSNTSSCKINDLYINSIINLYNNNNNTNNNNSTSNSQNQINITNKNKSLKLNYKTTKNRNPQRSLTSTITTLQLHNDCISARKTCILM